MADAKVSDEPGLPGCLGRSAPGIARRGCTLRLARLAREEFLHAVEETLAARRMFAGVFQQRLFELAQQLALFAVELHRCLDHDAAEQIAARPAAHGLHALVAQPEDAP